MIKWSYCASPNLTSSASLDLGSLNVSSNPRSTLSLAYHGICMGFAYVVMSPRIGNSHP